LKNLSWVQTFFGLGLPAQSLHKQTQIRRHFDQPLVETNAQSFADLRANRGVSDATYRTVVWGRDESHETPLVGRVKLATYWLAVTRRASRTFAFEFVSRKHDASKFGQTCDEQFADALSCCRSCLVSAISRASTCGAKVGKAITDAPSNMNIPNATRDLTIGLLTLL
jgi:hypothetical protein